MKFCNSCKTIHSKNTEVCPACGKKLKDITDINEPVLLCVIGGTERALLCGMLTDAAIPYMENNVIPQGVANEIVTGFDVKLSNINITVPFQALPEASGLLSSIETVENKIEPMLEEISAYIGYLRAKTGEPEMTPKKRTAVKIITAILFILLVAAVVLGTDAFTGWIKGLFGG